MTKKGTCNMKRRCLGIKYSDIGHHKGATIFWIIKNRIKKHLSQGTLKDFHLHVIRKIEKKEADLFWRGRATQEKDGVVSLLPPTRVYARKEEFSVPEKVVMAIKREFQPTVLVVQAKDGLRFLEESKK